ncbi:MAG: TPM domain-containing protein [Methylococcales bacterium]
MNNNGLKMTKVFHVTQVQYFRHWVAACLLLLLTGVCHAAPEFPQLTGRVVDEANLLSEQQKSRLTSLLAEHEEITSNQIVIVTLQSLQEYAIADYGYQLGRHWAIGQKDRNNGVLLIVAPNQRKVRIEVGYGLEGALTDVLASQIIQNEITPRFRDGDLSEGIEAGTSAILDAVVGEYRAKPRKTQFSGQSYVPDWEGLKSLFNFVVVIGIVLGFLRKRNAITTETIHKVLYMIVPMYVGVWLLSASFITASIVMFPITLFYVTPWIAKWISTMTLALTLSANLAIWIGLVYLLDFDTGAATLLTLFIAIFVIMPITHYKFPFFQRKHGDKCVLNCLFWFAISIFIVTTIWSLGVLLGILTDANVDLEKLVVGIMVAPFGMMFVLILSMLLRGQNPFGKLNSSRNNRSRNDSGFSSTSSSSSSGSSNSGFSSGGGRFGGGGSSGSW